MNELKAKIKYYMVLRGVDTIKDLSKRTGINKDTLRRRLCNMETMQLGELEIIFDALKVPREERSIGSI